MGEQTQISRDMRSWPHSTESVEWHEERNPVMKHGTLVRPTLYLARQGRSTWQRSWTGTYTRMDHCGLLRECLCLNAWKAVSLSNGACDKEAWKPHGCGKRWQPGYWPTWMKNGWSKKRCSYGYWRRSASNLQFYVARQLLDHIPLQENLEGMLKWRSG